MAHPAVLVVENYYRDVSAKAPAASFAEFFNLPAALIVGDRKVPLGTSHDVETIYDGLLRKYASEGIVRISWDPQQSTLVEICPGLALIKTIISRHAADDRIVKTWVCSYLMREADGRWKCEIATATLN
jgi:hypothetical protein